MADAQLTLGDLAEEVRSKNAGPFWVTLDVFLRDDADFAFLTGSGALTPAVIAALYRVDAADVKYAELPTIRAVKISFPRAVTAGSFADRDMHAGQQHIPLAGVVLPARPREA